MFTRSAACVVWSIAFFVAITSIHISAMSIILPPLKERVGTSDFAVKGSVISRIVLQRGDPSFAGPDRIKLRIRVDKRIPAVSDQEIEVTGWCFHTTETLSGGQPIMLLSYKYPQNDHPEDRLRAGYVFCPVMQGKYWLDDPKYPEMSDDEAWKVLQSLFEKTHGLPLSPSYFADTEAHKFNDGNLHEAQLALALLDDIFENQLGAAQIYGGIKIHYDRMRSEAQATNSVSLPPEALAYRKFTAPALSLLLAKAGTAEIEQMLNLYEQDRRDRNGNAFDDPSLEEPIFKMILKLPPPRRSMWLTKLVGQNVEYFDPSGNRIGGKPLMSMDRYRLRLQQESAPDIVAFMRNGN